MLMLVVVGAGVGKFVHRNEWVRATRQSGVRIDGARA
jgi:hypothetical protein